MPIDPILYPNAANPIQRVMQRQGSLEARVAALETKRDLTVSPWTILTGGSATVPYAGGRVWIVVSGKGVKVSGSPGSAVSLGADLVLNGRTITPIAGDSVLAYVGTSGNASAALPMRTVELTPATLASTYGVDPGESITLTSTLTNSSTGAQLSGLVIEWPSA